MRPAPPVRRPGARARRLGDRGSARRAGGRAAAVLAVLVLASAGLMGAPDARAAAPPRGFVTTCGPGLCVNGAPFRPRIASALGMDDRRAATVAMARAAGVNVLRLVDFLDVEGPLRGATSERRWRAVDRNVAAARRGGLRVELDLSTYRNLLVAHGLDPYARDWSRFLRFVATRPNTVTGVRYAEDPTIALVAFAGELVPPAYDPPDGVRRPTARRIARFFARTFAQYRALDPNHLRTTGGLLFLDDPHAGIDWRSLVALPGNDVGAIHVYSEADRTTGMANLASWRGGRPWIVEEAGAPQSRGDAGRAAWFGAVRERAAALGAAGTGFWNLGPEVDGASHDVNPDTPLAWSAVRGR